MFIYSVIYTDFVMSLFMDILNIISDTDSMLITKYVPIVKL